MKKISVLLFLVAITYTYYFQGSSTLSSSDPHSGEFWIAVSVFLFVISEIFLKDKPTSTQNHNNIEAIEDIINFTKQDHIDMPNIESTSSESKHSIKDDTVKKNILQKNSGMKVVYRIRGIGHAQTEILNTNSESEARRIMKLKYPSADIIISTVSYVRE